MPCELGFGHMNDQKNSPRNKEGEVWHDPLYTSETLGCGGVVPMQDPCMDTHEVDEADGDQFFNNMTEPDPFALHGAFDFELIPKHHNLTTADIGHNQ